MVIPRLSVQFTTINYAHNKWKKPNNLQLELPSLNPKRKRTPNHFRFFILHLDEIKTICVHIMSECGFGFSITDNKPFRMPDFNYEDLSKMTIVDYLYNEYISTRKNRRILDRDSFVRKALQFYIVDHLSGNMLTNKWGNSTCLSDHDFRLKLFHAVYEEVCRLFAPHISTLNVCGLSLSSLDKIMPGLYQMHQLETLNLGNNFFTINELSKLLPLWFETSMHVDFKHLIIYNNPVYCERDLYNLIQLCMNAVDNGIQVKSSRILQNIIMGRYQRQTMGKIHDAEHYNCNQGPESYILLLLFVYVLLNMFNF